MTSSANEPNQKISSLGQGIYTALNQENPRETVLAGSEYQDPYTDLKWSRQQPNGNWAIRVTGFVMRKAFRRGCSSITFDYPSFERAMSSVEPGILLVLAPTHRSMMDFIVCSYLCFSHPELKISIPYIAADLQIGGLPFLGWFLQQTYAFYLKRGQGKPDPELNQKIRQLVLDQQTLEIFIEGTRSRARQCLKPKRGLLRALQQTGETCALLPITINYDRLPEENALMKELKGGPKPLIKMKPLLRWIGELIKGQVNIGRVHLVCGEPVRLDGQSDVHAVSHAVMGELQNNYVTTSFHLQAFLHHHPIPGYDLESLTQALLNRGGTVIKSPFEDLSQVDKQMEYTFRNQWIHLFFPELQSLSPNHPIIQAYIQANSFTPRFSQPTDQDPRSEKALYSLLQTLFQPLLVAYAQVIKVAEEEEGLHYPNARMFVGQYSDCFLPMVEEALCHLEKAELLVKRADKSGFDLGPEWKNQADLYRSPLWMQESMIKY